MSPRHLALNVWNSGTHLGPHAADERLACLGRPGERSRGERRRHGRERPRGGRGARRTHPDPCRTPGSTVACGAPAARLLFGNRRVPSRPGWAGNEAQLSRGVAPNKRGRGRRRITHSGVSTSACSIRRRVSSSTTGRMRRSSY